MFSYYGGKKKIAHLYPKPLCGTIVEPFAGAAWYSLLYADRQVILNDASPIIYGIWNWLINEATSVELLKFSALYLGQDIRSLPIHRHHKDLLGFIINRGSAVPNHSVTKWCCQVASNPLFASTPKHTIVSIADRLSDIKHWQVFNKCYTSMPNITGTWFIDAPYVFGGSRYTHNSINFGRLKIFVSDRLGQTIVCENTRATWLPFQPLVNITGQKYKTTEALYHQIK